MLSVRQGDIKYHFLSLWYDSTWDWTPVSRTTRKLSTHSAHGPNKRYIVTREFELACNDVAVLYVKHYATGTYTSITKWYLYVYLFVYFFGFHGISTFVGYLKPNRYSYK